jgi:hypothetical protein
MKGKSGRCPVREIKRLVLEGRHRPSHRLRKGLALYQEFKGFPPSCLIKIYHPRVMPQVAVELGELVGIIYRSDKGQAGVPRNYIHFMENPPRLACNIEGTQLYIVGGSYRVTPQGIEG